MMLSRRRVNAALLYSAAEPRRALAALARRAVGVALGVGVRPAHRVGHERRRVERRSGPPRPRARVQSGNPHATPGRRAAGRLADALHDEQHGHAQRPLRVGRHDGHLVGLDAARGRLEEDDRDRAARPSARRPARSTRARAVALRAQTAPASAPAAALSRSTSASAPRASACSHRPTTRRASTPRARPCGAPTASAVPLKTQSPAGAPPASAVDLLRDAREARGARAPASCRSRSASARHTASTGTSTTGFFGSSTGADGTLAFSASLLPPLIRNEHALRAGGLRLEREPEDGGGRELAAHARARVPLVTTRAEPASARPRARARHRRPCRARVRRARAQPRRRVDARRARRRVDAGRAAPRASAQSSSREVRARERARAARAPEKRRRAGTREPQHLAAAAAAEELDELAVAHRPPQRARASGPTESRAVRVVPGQQLLLARDRRDLVRARARPHVVVVAERVRVRPRVVLRLAAVGARLALRRRAATAPSRCPRPRRRRCACSGATSSRRSTRRSDACSICSPSAPAICASPASNTPWPTTPLRTTLDEPVARELLLARLLASEPRARRSAPRSSRAHALAVRAQRDRERLGDRRAEPRSTTRAASPPPPPSAPCASTGYGITPLDRSERFGVAERAPRATRRVDTRSADEPRSRRAHGRGRRVGQAARAAATSASSGALVGRRRGFAESSVKELRRGHGRAAAAAAARSRPKSSTSTARARERARAQLSEASRLAPSA